MPRLKRRRVPLTDDWQQLRLFTQSRAQDTYEILRPCTLFGYSIAARARQVGLPERALRHKLDRFDRQGMASLFDLDPVIKPTDAGEPRLARALHVVCLRSLRPREARGVNTLWTHLARHDATRRSVRVSRRRGPRP